MGIPRTDYTRTFASRLGTVEDFVNYFRRIERLGKLRRLRDFYNTNGTLTGKRYLLIKKGGVIDFRHFFAAMMQRLDGKHTKQVSIGPTSEGVTLLLGVLNEVAQCLDEGVKRKLDSCFSKEDLISNRLGARFGEIIMIKRSEADRTPVADHLKTYLSAFNPMSPSEIQKLTMPRSGDVFLEAVGAVLKSLSDFLIPSAY